jgi:hypothetical protein
VFTFGAIYVELHHAAGMLHGGNFWDDFWEKMTATWVNLLGNIDTVAMEKRLVVRGKTVYTLNGKTFSRNFH